MPQRAMDHQRLVTIAILADVLQAESPGQIEIELYSCQLPGAADRVDQLHVDLRAVEGRLAFHALERHVHAGKRGFKRRG